MGLVFEEDGEFWMPFQDFLSNFDRVDIVHLGPESLLSDLPKGNFTGNIISAEAYNEFQEFYTILYPFKKYILRKFLETCCKFSEFAVIFGNL